MAAWYSAYPALVVYLYLARAEFNGGECRDSKNECHQLIPPCEFDDMMREYCPVKCAMCTPTITPPNSECLDHNACKLHTFPSECFSVNDPWPRENCLMSCFNCSTDYDVRKNSIRKEDETIRKDNNENTGINNSVKSGHNFNGTTVAASHDHNGCMAIDGDCYDTCPFSCMYCCLCTDTKYNVTKWCPTTCQVCEVSSKTLTDATLEVTVGSLLIHPCYDSCLSNCTLEWPKVSRSQELQNKSLNVRQDEVLQLTSIHHDDLGTYKCGAADRNYIIYCLLCITMKCAPRNTEGEDGLKEVYRIFSDEALSVRFKICGYPLPRIDSITSFDGDGKACILPTPEQYQQIINNNIAQPWQTLFILQFPRHVPGNLSCSYIINISNDAGNITMAFKTIAKDPRCDKCSPPSVTQAALISAVVILVVCLIIILAVTKLKRDLLKFSKYEAVGTHEIQEYRRSIEGSERGRTNFSATDCHIYNEPSDDIRLSGRGAAGRSSEHSDVTIQTCHLCGYSHVVRDMCLNAVRSPTANVPLRSSQIFVYSQSQRSAIPPIENRLSEQYDVCTMSDFTSSLESLCLPDIYRSDSKKKYYLNPVYENAACEDSLSDEADDYINLI